MEAPRAPATTTTEKTHHQPSHRAPDPATIGRQEANGGGAPRGTNDKGPGQDAGSSAEPAATSTTTATLETNEGQFSEQQNIDEECERLLRNAKKQVKQMMEEAVTRKFIHEESSSIIALCVAIDNCLSHGLKRRALGLFKSNSSTALIQKVAKSCTSAREILNLVDDEEKRQLGEQQQQQQQQQQQLQLQLQQQQQQQRKQHDSHRSPMRLQQAASNLSVHKRNRWIKCALIERKLVPIVEYLSENASKYYEPEALMSNYLSAQILCSLLVGPCALEFSRSKTNDYYQFEEPSADELLKRHKLSNPIACIHNHHHHHQHHHPHFLSHHHHHNTTALVHGCKRVGSPVGPASGATGTTSCHAQLSRSATDNQSYSCHRQGCHWCNQHRQHQETSCCPNGAAHRSRRATTSQDSAGTKSVAAAAAAATAASVHRAATGPQGQLAETRRSTSDSVAQSASSEQPPAGSTTMVGLARAGSGGGGGGGASGQRRRPLALKTNMKIGALVTDCHHYSCQDISEHQQTRGYSFKCDGLNGLSSSSLNSAGTAPSANNNKSVVNQTTSGSASNGIQQQESTGNVQQQQQNGTSTGGSPNWYAGQQVECWPTWSPRMLHETLHQNSKSTLLYAKNNVLLETQPNETMAGYLSLHQTSSDLILKWIPNQMINGCSSLPLACEAPGGGGGRSRAVCCGCCSCCNASSDSAEILEGEQSNRRDEASSGASNKIRSKSEDITPNNTNSSSGPTSRRRRHNLNSCCCANPGSSNYPEVGSRRGCSQPVGSSYLDLIVSLSVSRIAMLHCHFDGHVTTTTRRRRRSTKSSGQEATASDTGELEFEKDEGAAPTTPGDHQLSEAEEKQAAENQGSVPSSSSTTNLDQEQNLSSASDTTTTTTTANLVEDTTTTTTRFFFSTNEETLILVETDGVQRAPFKFPKGGLKWFLSCLEAGLRPHKYLDPSVKPDQPIGEMLPDHPVDLLLENEDRQLSGSGGGGAVNAGAGGDQQNAASRLDMFLRRLPSLKRRTDTATRPKCTPDSQRRAAAATSLPDSRATSPTTPTASEPAATSAAKQTVTSSQRVPINYVYRIVSVQQQQQQQLAADYWGPQRQQTPPPSATFSIGSASSGGSFGLAMAAASLIKTNSNSTSSNSKLATPVACGPHQADSGANNGGAGGGQQRFRWSLSRLARFSSKHNSNSAGSTSTSSSICYNGNNSSNNNNNNSTQDDGCNERAEESSLSSREFARIEAKLEDLKKSSSDELIALRTQSIQTLCESMRKQILARAFYGWLAYCRRAKIIRLHLRKLIHAEVHLLRAHEPGQLADGADGELCEQTPEGASGLTRELWTDLRRQVEDRVGVEAEAGAEAEAEAKAEVDVELELKRQVMQLVYYGGIESNELRVEVWPYLLEHYKFSDDAETRRKKDQAIGEAYRSCSREWVKVERVVKQRDNEILAANMAKVARRNKQQQQQQQQLEVRGQLGTNGVDQGLDGPTGADAGDVLNNDRTNGDTKVSETATTTTTTTCDEDAAQSDDNRQVDDIKSEHEDKSEEEDITEEEEDEEEAGSRGKTNDDQGQDGANEDCADTTGDSNVDTNNGKASSRSTATSSGSSKDQTRRRTRRGNRRVRLESTGSVGSDASITDQFGNNVHRIDKDVQRCDRNFWYFKETDNLEKLRNIMCNYVWQHLDIGYVQGMCDLAAPFLVIFDDEVKAYTCFNQLMKRMVANFPHGCAMDQHFESLKYLIQVLDPKLFEIFQRNGDYTHFYFCYRWLLLDFKRELAYDDVYRVWETIWAARYIATDQFVVFMALAMVRYYRDIIIENNMDFTDTIKFFNEMAERHDARSIIALARDCVVELEALVKSHGDPE